MCNEGCAVWTKDNNLCGNCADWRRLVAQGHALPVNIEDVRPGMWVCPEYADEYRETKVVIVDSDDGKGDVWMRVCYNDGGWDTMRKGEVMFESGRRRKND